MNECIINKIKSQKKNYLLYINKTIYTIDYYFYECILPYEGKKIDNKTMQEIEAFSLANKILPKLYNKIFNNRLSVYEVKSKLKTIPLDEKQINIIIDFLKNEGHLDDIKLIKCYQEIYQNNKGYKAFKNFLINKHISSYLIEKYTINYKENFEYALDYAQKYVDNKTSSNIFKKNMVKAHLINKGFSQNIINQVIEKLNFKDDSDILRKEMHKYYLKYQNDKYKIISKLANKGYNVNEIKKIMTEEGMFNED